MHAHHNPALFCDGRCGQDKTRLWGQPNSALAAWSKSHLCLLSIAQRETWTKAHLCILSTDRPESPTRTLGWPPGRRRASSPSPAHDPNRLGVYWSLGPPQPTGQDNPASRWPGAVVQIAAALPNEKVQSTPVYNDPSEDSAHAYTDGRCRAGGPAPTRGALPMRTRLAAGESSESPFP